MLERQELPVQVYSEFAAAAKKKLSGIGPFGFQKSVRRITGETFVGNVVNLSEMLLFGLVIRPNEV